MKPLKTPNCGQGLFSYNDIGKVPAQIAVYRRHAFQTTKQHGRRRYVRDKVAFKLFRELDPETLFPEQRDEVEMALQLESLAKMMLASPPTPLIRRYSS